MTARCCSRARRRRRGRRRRPRRRAAAPPAPGAPRRAGGATGSAAFPHPLAARPVRRVPINLASRPLLCRRALVSVLSCRCLFLRLPCVAAFPEGLHRCRPPTALDRGVLALRFAAGLESSHPVMAAPCPASIGGQWRSCSLNYSYAYPTCTIPVHQSPFRDPLDHIKWIFFTVSPSNRGVSQCKKHQSTQKIRFLPPLTVVIGM